MSSRGSVFAWVILAQATLLAQSIVSVRSGVINFFEGSVLVDGQKLEPKFGKFYDVKQGSKLWTEDGRAEVLLTPGSMLRVGEESSIRMISTSLTDTRVEFGGGEIAVDSRMAKASSGSSTRITYKGFDLTLSVPGRYRFTSQPAELRVREGEAKVTFNGRTILVHDGHSLPFTPAMAAQRLDDDGEDSLDRWNNQRAQTLAAGNAAAAASDDMSSAIDTAPAPGTIFADIPLYAPAYGSGWNAGIGPGYYGSPYWGIGGVYPFLYGLPRTSRVGSPLWNYYPGGITTRPSAAWHSAPRSPVFRAPAASHPVNHAPAVRSIGHR